VDCHHKHDLVPFAEFGNGVVDELAVTDGSGHVPFFKPDSSRMRLRERLVALTGYQGVVVGNMPTHRARSDCHKVRYGVVSLQRVRDRLKHPHISGTDKVHYAGMLRLTVAVDGTSPAHCPVETVEDKHMGSVHVASYGSFTICRLFLAAQKGDALDFSPVQVRTRQIIHALEFVKRGQRFVKHSQPAYRTNTRQSVANLVDEELAVKYLMKGKEV
jgi:hypothetical protein